MESYYRISFLGDIMCEKQLQRACSKGTKYDFSTVFSEVRELFSKSEIIVGNLETVFAGKEKGYTNDLYSFNTPDDFLVEVKKAGINYVTTANNHCLDRGIEGMLRTLERLDELKIKHFGTYKTKEDRSPYEKVMLGEGSVALLGYTYGTNVAENKIVFREEDFLVNLLKSQKRELIKFNNSVQVNTFRGRLSKYIRKITNLEQRMKIKRTLGILHNKSGMDELESDDICDEYIRKLISDVRIAKAENDYVIVCLHSGGLFNKEIGSYTKYIVNILRDEGVDFIIGHHPHIVQKSEYVDGLFTAYSLGNFSISPSSIYVLHDNLPEYSVMPHLYFDKSSGKFVKATFSILKIVEEKDGRLTVWPVNVLGEELGVSNEYERLKKDSTFIFNCFTQSSADSIELQEEYALINGEELI